MFNSWLKWLGINVEKLVKVTDQFSPVFLGFLIPLRVVHRDIQLWGSFLLGSIVQDIPNLKYNVHIHRHIC